MKKVRLKKWVWFVLIFFVIGMIGWFFFYEDKMVMKDLSSFHESEIKKYAEDLGLQLDLSYEYHDTIEEGKVISQSIETGTKIEDHMNLKVILSLGKLDEDALRDAGVNEMGKVPVMMYHGIHNLKNEDTDYTGGNVDKDGYQRTAEAFRKDLEMYYQEGYRMIRLSDYVDGIIDVPFGKSPIVLTFDDGLKNNILVTGVDENGDIIIDPNSAVGILEEFKKKYPDFGVTATFFINGGLFEQPQYNKQIIEYLIEHGYDIGNHTYTHPDFTKISYDTAVSEVGKMYALLEQYAGDQYVSIIALPYGSPYKKTHDNFKAILSGTYDGVSYQTKATLQVGWESNVSPFSKNFDPQFIKRIRAYDNNGTEFDIAYCFEALKKNRFISDGNKDQITIPEENLSYVSENRKLPVITY